MNRSRCYVWFLVGEGKACYENSYDLLENTCYMLSWQGISDVTKEKQSVINAIVTLMIYIDWYIKTSSQQNNESYSCQSFFLSFLDCNSSTAQANSITTTKDIPVPSNPSTYPIQNRCEWMNHQLTAEEEMMYRVTFYFKFVCLTLIKCIWFKFSSQKQILICQN